MASVFFLFVSQRETIENWKHLWSQQGTINLLELIIAIKICHGDLLNLNHGPMADGDPAQDLQRKANHEAGAWKTPLVV